MGTLPLVLKQLALAWIKRATTEKPTKTIAEQEQIDANVDILCELMIDLNKITAVIQNNDNDLKNKARLKATCAAIEFILEDVGMIETTGDSMMKATYVKDTVKNEENVRPLSECDDCDFDGDCGECQAIERSKEVDIEALAECEHIQWSHWIKYFLDNITPKNIAKWRKQANTPYSELSEVEKEEDREWAYKVIDLL